MKKTANRIFFWALLLFTVQLCAGQAGLGKANNISARIVSPKNGQRFDACQDITIKVEVTVQSGEVDRVYFYKNGGALGSVRSEPWEKTMEAAAPGIYNLTVKVRDGDKNDYFSLPVQIFVDPIEDGDLLINGEFACGQSPWTLEKWDAGEAVFEIVEEGYLSEHEPMAFIDITNTGGENWHVLLSTPFPIDSGKTYQIYFMAEVEEAKSIGLNFQGGDGTVHSWQNLDLDPDVIDYGPFPVTSMITDATNNFKIPLGSNTQSIYLDAIRIYEEGWVANPTGVGLESTERPTDFVLNQNYPNPFNPTTTIRFTVPFADKIRLSVFDIQGRLVKQIFDQRLSAGSYNVQWDAKNQRGESVPGGVYIYKLKTAEKSRTKRMVLLR